MEQAVAWWGPFELDSESGPTTRCPEEEAARPGEFEEAAGCGPKRGGKVSRAAESLVTLSPEQRERGQAVCGPVPFAFSMSPVGQIPPIQGGGPRTLGPSVLRLEALHPEARRSREAGGL